MELYHYTSAQHLDRILGSGVLITSESNIGAPRTPDTATWAPLGEHVGPDVVWLTTSTDATGHGLTGSNVAKGEVRILVELPDHEVHNWSDWARSHGIHEEWLARLNRAGGADTWRIIERDIPHDEWVIIEGLPLSAADACRNDPCPCGSGDKFKRCCLGRRPVLWTPEDGIEVRYTPQEARSTAVEATGQDASGRTIVQMPDGTLTALEDER